MTEPDMKELQMAKEAMQAALSSHGYGFQYAVSRRAAELTQSRYPEEHSVWKPLAAEFPVSVQDAGTRIDLLMECRRPHYYLIGECKRANPALARWCFARGRTGYNHQPTLAILEKVWAKPDKRVFCDIEQLQIGRDQPYGIAVETKMQAKGDSAGGGGRGAIEEAVTQVLRGVNGFSEFLAKHPDLLGDTLKAVLLPVIFTTAHLWVTDKDLAESDLQTGETDLTEADVQEVGWLLYHYQQSPGLKHALLDLKTHNSISDVVSAEYSRTVAIVSAGAVDSFLLQASDVTTW